MAQTCALKIGVLRATTMGWTASCQKRRWNLHTAKEWEDWIDQLPDEGFGRYTKSGWTEWAGRMLEMHGLPTKGQPAQGQPAQGAPTTAEGPPAERSMEGFARPSPDHPLRRLYDQAMEDATHPPPGTTAEDAFVNRMMSKERPPGRLDPSARTVAGSSRTATEGRTRMKKPSVEQKVWRVKGASSSSGGRTGRRTGE